MARKKIVQAWITDDVVRRNTLKKRRNGLMKKMKEFTTLCDVQACAIVYGPHDAEPEVWPNIPEATMMLQSFQELPEIIQGKKMMTQEIFLQEKLNKTIQQYQRLENQIQEMENSILIYEFMSGRDMDELDLQEAGKAYYTAESKMKVGFEQIKNTMAVQRRSSEGVYFPPFTKEDCYLDGANFNQQVIIQQPVINYVKNQNQMMIAPYVNDQMMHQQANIGSSSNNMAIASNVQNENQAMESSAGEVHQQLANMEEDHLWMNPKLFG